MWTSSRIFVEVRAVLMAFVLMMGLSVSGCVPQPAVQPAAPPIAQSESAPSAAVAAVPDVVQPAAVIAAVGESAGESVAVPVPVSEPVEIVEPTLTNAHEPHPRAAQYKRALVQQAHYVWGLDAPVASFAAQIHQESRWNANARSPVGAAGLTQFMPATARWIAGMDGELRSGDVYNPRWAMRALVVYDKWLYERAPAVNPCEQLAFAMSAYNGGLGWVNKRKARSSNPRVCFGVTCEINPGVSAASQRENAGYPKVILKGFEAQYVRAGWGRGVCHAR